MAGEPVDELKGLVLTDADDGAPAVIPEGSGESKVKVVLGLLKKLIGVSDVANLRLSLPASLLEPIPNLEYWHYADRPDVFASVGDSPDELERMISVLRYSFSKELKFVRYKIGKPYNSTLGEHFRCSWSLPTIGIDPKTKAPVINVHKFDPTASNGELVAMSAMSTPQAGPVDIRDDVSVRSLGGTTGASRPPTTPTTPVASKSKFGRKETVPSGGSSSTNLFGKSKDQDKANAASEQEPNERVDVVYLTEQVSHHPPISSAYYACPAKGVEMTCVDQISAKVSFPSVQITPGSANQGLFIKLSDPSPGAGEEYNITHPIAQVNGIIRGQYYGTISDKVIISCRSPQAGLRMKAITEYKDESWLGKPKFALEGLVFAYDPNKPEEVGWNKLKSVPTERVVAQYEGAWRKQIKWKRKGEKDWRVLIDMDALDLVPKDVRPLTDQHEHESRNLWNGVTQHINNKNWGEATKEKQVIEQKQRDDAASLKREGKEHIPRFFLPDIADGKPQLSTEGKKAVQEELERVRRSFS